MELYAEAAERLGYIVVSTNNFRSGSSTETTASAMVSLWNDATRRFPLDLHRVYATGFSGGGRICWTLDRLTQDVPFAGIIEVGAGFPWDLFPEEYDPSGLAYCGIAGEIDFNYYEMERVDQLLSERQILRRFVTFEGRHQWPSAEVCGEALEWLEVVAIKTRGADRDSELVEAYHQREIDRAKELAEMGRLLDAHRQLLSLVETCRDLRETATAESLLVEVASHPEWEAQVDKHRRQADWAKFDTERIFQMLEAIVEEVRAPKGLTERSLAEVIDLPFLLERASKEDREESLSAKRVLEHLYARLAYDFQQTLKDRHDPARAAIFLSLAAQIRPESPLPWYRLAQAYALIGSSEEALDALDRAVANGFDDAELLRSDPELESIRQDPRFLENLARIP